MQCQKVQRKISAYIDGELDAASSRSVERHISQCGICREMVADFADVNVLVRGLPKLDMGPDFIGQLLERVSESQAPFAGRCSDRSLFATIMRFMSSFMDLLDAGKSPSTKTLDEFGDFPPSSIGYIYFKLLDQTGRG